jgi:hypothetical protein
VVDTYLVPTFKTSRTVLTGIWLDEIDDQEARDGLGLNAGHEDPVLGHAQLSLSNALWTCSSVFSGNMRLSLSPSPSNLGSSGVSSGSELFLRSIETSDMTRPDPTEML